MWVTPERDLQRNLLRGKARKEPVVGEGGTTVQNPQLQFVMVLPTAKVDRKSCTQQNGCLGCEGKPRQGWPRDCVGKLSLVLSLSADRVGCLEEEEEARHLPLSSAPFPKFRGS